MNELHIKTPHERVTAFNDRIKKAADKLKKTDDKDAKKMLQNKIKLAKLGLQSYKQQQALKSKEQKEKKAAQMKSEEITQLTNDQREMVNGIIDLLLQVDDLNNRMEIAKQQIQNFKDENINFNYAWFLSAAGLDNKDEPVGISTYAPTSTHISPVSINSNMKTTEMKEAQQKLVYNINKDAVEAFLKKYPKVKQVMGVIASKNKDLLKGYKAFIKFKDSKEDYLGGNPEGSNSPTFGSKVFYKYDFGMLKYHWPEIYQYVHSQQNESVNEAVNPQMLKDLDKVKNDLLKKAEVLIAKKKKLYSDVDIESPMSDDEKKLDKEIADVFSQINQIVLQKRKVKNESLNEEAPIYKDWDEFVRPDYIIVYLKDGKKLKIAKNKMGGKVVYYAVLKAFNDNNYKITNKIVGAMLDKLGESINEGKYYIGYNKGRGQGKGVFKDTYSTYKEAQKEVEKIQKMMSGSHNMTAYYVADSKGEMVHENWDSEMKPVKRDKN